MAEISSSRIESIPDPGSGRRDKPDQTPQKKVLAAGRTAPPKVPEIGAADEEDQHKLDEMA